ncbi:tellurite resistance/C4-dicarboxylate transporter family protein [Nocardia sp. NPDC056000]|uniref:tellurite resistance/C4-dicarboxylate transporter family protein n=1 Tax=Nocardia sp. NPDC056000 TaxID=3345674 RepID=UPI0035DADC33
MTQRPAWTEMPPAAGAFVIATGILSVGLHLTDFETLSRIALAVAGVVWVLLAVDFATRLLWDHSRWETESDTPPALTAIAATTVLGTRIALLGWHAMAVALLVLAAAVWPVLLVSVLRHWNRRMPGAAFLVCVSTQGLAVLGSTLALAHVADWLMPAALVFFILGLILYAAAFTHFDFTQIWKGAGDQWVAAGAVAISTLAASKLAAWPHWTGNPHNTLRVVTAILLTVTLLAYVVLCVAEIMRYRPGYDVRRWATVFPLGMTAVATLSTGAVLEVPWLHALGKALLAFAIAAWILVAVEWMISTRTGRIAPTPRTPPARTSPR